MTLMHVFGLYKLTHSNKSHNTHNTHNMSRARSYVFTVNNWTEEHQTKLRMFAPSCKYLVFGREVGESGTPHLQGYLTLKSAKTGTALSRAVGFTDWRWEVAKGSPHQNKVYCTKGGDFEEFGDIPTPGKRTEFEAFKDAVKDGVRDMKQLREEHPMVCAKYPRFVREYLDDHAPRVATPDIALTDWQQQLIEMIKQPPPDRKIVFVVDVEGGRGKTTFCKYIMSLFDNVQLMDPGKLADMAYEMQETTRVLLMDCPRSRTEILSYHFLEKIKDGFLHSGKYESRLKTLVPCHVIVFMNEVPDAGKLSRDRFDIRVIG